MSQETYSADHVVALAQGTFRRVYKAAMVLWVLGLAYIIFQYSLSVPADLEELVRFILFRVLGGHPELWFAILLAPFWLQAASRLVVGLLVLVRRRIHARTAFDSVTQSRVLGKLKVHGGSSETDWIRYHLEVEHPVSRQAMNFSVPERIYAMYEANGMIEVRYNPRVGSVLFIDGATARNDP